MNNIREFLAGFVLAVGLCVLGFGLIYATGAHQKIEQAVQSGVLVWHGKAYVVEEMGDRS